MRIRITFHALNEPLVLPLSYHEFLQGLLYKFLWDSDQLALHDSPGFKYIVFSQLSGAFSLDRENKEICFPGSVTWSIGSLYPQVLVQMGLHHTSNQFLLAENSIVIDEVNIDTTAITQESIRIKMISPVTVYRTLPNGQTLYYPPQSQDFSDLINSNFERKYQVVREINEANPIRIRPLGETKKANILYKNFTILSYLGEYQLSGKKEYLQFLYDTGLGDKNTQGFGMFDLLP
jgi:CRISPR-associated endoribonuclease Cas6